MMRRGEEEEEGKEEKDEGERQQKEGPAAPSFQDAFDRYSLARSLLVGSSLYLYLSPSFSSPPTLLPRLLCFSAPVTVICKLEGKSCFTSFSN
ncbi:unnamed protein product [Taenia asiatica]|uniref:Uncharacterized protein n=1 Tax=Taenia asiatica TaxID=60517 RepID=A0A0R3VUN2_TAEAS|nr:unnamed protein product [Taenia asiatica]